MSDLGKNKETLILGVGNEKGIGYGIARAYSRQGERVHITGRETSQVVQLAGQLGADPHILDLADPVQVEGTFQTLASNFPLIETIIYVAGFMPQEIGFWDISQREILATAQANFLGIMSVLTSISYFNGISRFALMGSIVGERLPGTNKNSNPVYNATKAAGHNILRQVGSELRKRGIIATLLIPPTTQTRMVAHLNREGLACPLEVGQLVYEVLKTREGSYGVIEESGVQYVNLAQYLS